MREVEAVATLPALSVDLELAGGLGIAVEATIGRDLSGVSRKYNDYYPSSSHHYHCHVVDATNQPFW